jgi:hypothetical protein
MAEFGADAATSGFDWNDVKFDGPYWLEIQVQGDASPLSPCSKLLAAPFSNALFGFGALPASTPNIIGGHSDNSVSAGIIGATISGGGQISDPILCIEPSMSNYAPNWIAGNNGNRVGLGVKGATISGGGYTDNIVDARNSVGGDFGTVGGSVENVTYTDAVVGGGSDNTAQGEESTIGGGKGNLADGKYSLAAGFYARTKHDGSFV